MHNNAILQNLKAGEASPAPLVVASQSISSITEN
jgi:hypothetical protein